MASLRPKKKSGFTILEVLITSVIVGISMFAIMEAFNRGYLGIGEAGDYAAALSLAQEKMEMIQDASFASVANEAKAVVSGFSDFQRKVDVDPNGSPHADLKDILVTTYWSVLAYENSITLRTYIVNQ